MDIASDSSRAACRYLENRIKVRRMVKGPDLKMLQKEFVTDCDNWRDVTPFTTVSHVFTRIILLGCYMAGDQVSER